VLRLLVSIVIGGASYQVLHSWLKLGELLSITISAAAAAISFLLENAKKLLEIEKLFRDRGEQRAADKQRQNVVTLPTPEEIQKYGVSIQQRAIDRYVRLEGEKEMLKLKEFLARVEETDRK